MYHTPRPAPQCIAIKNLTPREHEVLNYLIWGNANKVIAMELGISMRTVETHRARIFHKMGVRNAIELLRVICAPNLQELGFVIPQSGTEVKNNPSMSGTCGEPALGSKSHARGPERE